MVFVAHIWHMEFATMLRHVPGLVNEDHSMFAFEPSTVLAGRRHRDTKAHLSRRYVRITGGPFHAGFLSRM